MQQKLILLGIFGMGTFVVAAAILCKVYGLYPPLISYEYLNWFFREASVSVYVTNLPAIYSILRDAFPALARWGYTNKSSANRSNGGSRMDANGGKEYPMKPFNRLGSTMTDKDGPAPTQSQEHIITYHNRTANPLEIHKAVTFTVQKESSDDEDLEAALPPNQSSQNHAWAESGHPIVR